MIQFSARILYIMLASIIVLFFAGTSLYYFLDKKDAPLQPETYLQVNTVSDQQNTTADQNQQTTTNTDSQPTQQATTTNDQSGEQLDTLLAQSSTTTTNNDQSSTSSLQCYDICTFNYQCPGDLQCMDINGINRCAHAQCETDSSCGCAAEGSIANDTSLAFTNETFNAEATNSGDTQVFTNLSDSSNDTTENAAWSTPDLPVAGAAEWTLLVLGFGAISTVGGVVWARRQVK